ncbi:MAG: flagellar type III secretion system pore protein FliP [Bryobacteraceae bacterium]
MIRLISLCLTLAGGILTAATSGSLVEAAKGQKAPMDLPMQITLLLTGLVLLPAILMSVTPFLRIVVVLHFLRQALGTQTVPSNQVLVGLALFLTIFLVQPVGHEIYEKSWMPYERGTLSAEAAVEAASAPVTQYLSRFVREKDIALLLDVSHTAPPAKRTDLSLAVLLPAYILSELKTAFQIGAVLFLPFLIVDLLVASITLSVGMVQLPPVMISAPLKVLLFVLVDGWNLVVGSLVKSFY